MRVVRIPWRVLLPAAMLAFLAALAGASLVSAVSPTLFRPLVPIMLTAVLIYVLWHKDLGALHAPVVFSRRRGYLALAAVGGIGLYDGFFGPGTGSFLMLLFIRIYGFDFLHASVSARTGQRGHQCGRAIVFWPARRRSLGHWSRARRLQRRGRRVGRTHRHQARAANSSASVFIVIVMALITKTAWPMPTFDASRVRPLIVRTQRPGFIRQPSPWRAH